MQLSGVHRVQAPSKSQNRILRFVWCNLGYEMGCYRAYGYGSNLPFQQKLVEGEAQYLKYRRRLASDIFPLFYVLILIQLPDA